MLTGDDDLVQSLIAERTGSGYEVSIERDGRTSVAPKEAWLKILKLDSSAAEVMQVGGRGEVGDKSKENGLTSNEDSPSDEKP
jgi:hypothetical protein